MSPIKVNNKMSYKAFFQLVIENGHIFVINDQNHEVKDIADH